MSPWHLDAEGPRVRRVDSVEVLALEQERVGFVIVGEHLLMDKFVLFVVIKVFEVILLVLVNTLDFVEAG